MTFKKIITLAVVVLMTVQLEAQEIANITDPRLEIKLPTVKGDTITLSSLKGKVLRQG